MIRPILFAAIAALSSTRAAIAEEPGNFGNYLHLVTMNGVSACGPFEFFKLTRKQERLPGLLVGGQFLRSQCGTGPDVAVAGTIDKTYSEVLLYQLADDGLGDYSLWAFQWPLQNGGWWKLYYCLPRGNGCESDTSGTYDQGFKESSRVEKPR